MHTVFRPPENVLAFLRRASKRCGQVYLHGSASRCALQA